MKGGLGNPFYPEKQLTVILAKLNKFLELTKYASIY